MLPQETTHQLLLTLFFAETGLHGAPPLHPEAQLNLVVESFPAIQQNIANPLWVAENKLPWSYLSGLTVTRETEAHLFLKVYETMKQHQEDGFSTSTILSYTVDPAIRYLIQRTPALADILKTEFANHLAKHSFHVGERVLRSLDTFRLGFLVPVHPL
jgi:hypothetical protein